MSDFWGRLANRTLASTPAIRPRVASLFEVGRELGGGEVRFNSEFLDPPLSPGEIGPPGTARRPRLTGFPTHQEFRDPFPDRPNPAAASPDVVHRDHEIGGHTPPRVQPNAGRPTGSQLPVSLNERSPDAVVPTASSMADAGANGDSFPPVPIPHSESARTLGSSALPPRPRELAAAATRHSGSTEVPETSFRDPELHPLPEISGSEVSKSPQSDPGSEEFRSSSQAAGRPELVRPPFEEVRQWAGIASGPPIRPQAEVRSVVRRDGRIPRGVGPEPEDHAAAPPEVHITIGRVEIRAIPSDAAPRSRVPAAPRVSLEDILKPSRQAS